MSDAAALQDAIEELRAAGAAQRDPVRFAYLEGLSRRVGSQDDAVRTLLLQKFDAALAECRLSVVPAQAGTQKRTPWIPASAGTTNSATPLAHLNEHIRATLAAREDASTSHEPRARDELPNARRFLQAWSAAQTLDRVQEALARKPAQAGPLNSHALVLHSLALMRALSPDYLRRFLHYAESLQWLQHAGEQLPRPQAKAAKPAKRARRKA